MKTKTNENQNEKKPSVVFTNCKNYGDEIKALISFYTGKSINDFVLEEAFKGVRENTKKIEEFKQNLLKNK